MKIRITLFYFLIFSSFVFAQIRSEKEKLISDLYEKGIELRGSQKDSSYYYLDLATKLSIDLKNYSTALDMILESIFASGIHYDLKKYRSYLKKMETLLQNDSVKTTLKDLEFYQNRLVYEEGSYLCELKDYAAAKAKFQDLYEIYSKKEIAKLGYNDLSFLIYSTNFLASIYMDLGKYDLAENYFNRALAVVENNELAKAEGFDRSTNRLLAQLYITMGKHVKANAILKKLLRSYKQLYTKDKEYKNNVVVVYQRLVNNLVMQDSLVKALEHLEDSQSYLISEDPFYKESLLLYGDIYLKLQENQKAFKYYQDALDFFREYRQNKPHEDIAKVHGKIAELYLKQNKFEEGLETIKKAFNTNGKHIQIANDQENPNPDEVFSKTQLLHLLDIKLQLLQGYYEETADSNVQQAALKTNNDILKTFDLLKSEFDSKVDKQFLAEKAYPVFHRMLEVAHTAYEEYPSTETLQLALNIAEKNKDFVLLEVLRSAQATKYGGVPQKVLDRETQLRAAITYIEKQIFDATETKSGFSDELFTLKQEYYSFLDSIKIKYPEYHDLKYQSTDLDLAEVRKKVLGDNGILVSYTMADHYLYAIVLNGSKEKFLKMPFSDTDKETISDFYKLLSSPSIKGAEEKITLLGRILYDKILKNPLQGFDGENLMIIPDGVLHYLPFDLLQKNGSYLLTTKNFGYGNSVTSLMELREKKVAKENKILAFAPSFPGTLVANSDRQFRKLLYNDDEVSKIGEFFDAETVLDQKATLANFKAKSANFNIVHLATHASANDAYPDYSYLAFTEAKDSAESNMLYIKDLYNTSLNTDMVTLSACQTGIGKLQKGQGMLSLSKGFYYAGAKSLVNTLWKINDKSTVKLMEYFYKGLSEGKSKTQALRDAKLKYLETTEDNLLKHPYYWAAFVVSGDVSPIIETHYWWYVGAGALFFVVLFFIARRKGRIKEFRRVVMRTSSLFAS